MALITLTHTLRGLKLLALSAAFVAASQVQVSAQTEAPVAPQTQAAVDPKADPNNYSLTVSYPNLQKMIAENEREQAKWDREAMLLRTRAELYISWWGANSATEGMLKQAREHTELALTFGGRVTILKEFAAALEAEAKAASTPKQ